MGMGTNIIVFLILFAFGLSVYNCAGPNYAGSECPFTTSYTNLVHGFTTNLFSNFNSFGGLVLGTASVIIGTFVFPNPYAIFLGVSIAVLSLVVPAGVLPAPFNGAGAIYSLLSSQTGLPVPVMNLLSGIFCTVFIIAILSWYAGRDVF